MQREPKVYIALENEAGQLVVQGPLELLDRLVTTLAGQGGRCERMPELASEPEERGVTPRTASTGEASRG